MGAAAEKGWSDIAPMKQYIYFEDIRLGSSFDFVANGNEIVEIKNVSERAYAKSWSEDEAAPHIELQIQTQLLVSGFKKAWICALVGGNTIKIIERDFMPSVGESILKKVKHFWERKDEPKVDFERDAEFISLLYQNVDPNKIIQADDRLLELATRYNQLSSQISLAEQKKEATKAEILTLVRDAEKVRHEKFTISLGMTKQSIVKEHVRAARRGFRLTMRDNENGI
jgi:predicted phage-related endonuclease